MSARSDHDCCRPDTFCPTSRLHVVQVSDIFDPAHVAQHTQSSTMPIACSLTAVCLIVQGQGQLCLAGISLAASAGAAAVCCHPLLAPHPPGSRLGCCSGTSQHPDYKQQCHQPHCVCCCCWSHIRWAALICLLSVSTACLACAAYAHESRSEQELLPTPAATAVACSSDGQSGMT